MSTSASMPFPIGARVTMPPSRSIAHAWAAPRAADLVLDPWAAPAGPPIAQTLLSPWPAPDAAMRIVTMPPPPSLVPLPDLSHVGALLSAPLPPPSSATAAEAITVTNHTVEYEPAATFAPVEEPLSATGRLRARMVAMIAGGVAAVVGVVTVIAVAF
ncbi:MAG: hypothetical protein AAFP84_19975 [Actinomycetota bacterium]